MTKRQSTVLAEYQLQPLIDIVHADMAALDHSGIMKPFLQLCQLFFINAFPVVNDIQVSFFPFLLSTEPDLSAAPLMRQSMLYRIFNQWLQCQLNNPLLSKLIRNLLLQTDSPVEPELN